MELDNQQHKICTLEYITEVVYNELKQLENLCLNLDKTNLKLELDYKLFISKSAATITETVVDNFTESSVENVNQINSLKSKKSNEFLYYIDDTLVAYIGISSFSRNIAEINGMTHPDWRGKGIFHTLFNLVTKECLGRGFSKILLLSDGKSESGIAYIQSVGGIYDSSEYRMKLIMYPSLDEASIVSLRIAKLRDKKKIAELNSVFFGYEDENADEMENNSVNNEDYTIDKQIEIEEGNVVAPEEERMDGDPNTDIYMVELAGEVIGKIHVDYGINSAFICGFGILPDFRRNGYGKAALKEALRIISSKNISEVSLDVLCTNSKALNLYIGVGFEQQSIMNYYQYLLEG